MPPAPQPIALAQQPLAAHWQAWQAAPALRLGRWLVAEADRPLLHDYLLGLSADPAAALRRLASTERWVTALPGPAEAATVWLDPLPPDAEPQLRKLLETHQLPRLLVLEDAATQPLQRLARWFPAQVHTCTPAASMQQLLAAIRQAPALADEPAGRFQQQFHLLTEAMARADARAVAAHTETCLAAAAALPGPGAAVSVWLAGGHYLLAQKQPDEAGRHFAAARAVAEAASASAAGDPAAGLLSVQAGLSEAAAWQQRRRRSEALAALQQAVDRAGQLPANILGVEAARQLGLALEQDGQARPALASYQRGLHLAEQLPAEQRPAATVRALG
ncbi:MAG: hypothetical protein EOO59_12705, partial [Hymenobacter sp.]